MQGLMFLSFSQFSLRRRLWSWATQTLAQASEVRLSEIVMKLRVLSATSCPDEGFVGFGRLRVSPKRDGLA